MAEPPYGVSCDTLQLGEAVPSLEDEFSIAAACSTLGDEVLASHSRQSRWAGAMGSVGLPRY